MEKEIIVNVMGVKDPSGKVTVFAKDIVKCMLDRDSVVKEGKLIILPSAFSDFNMQNTEEVEWEESLPYEIKTKKAIKNTLKSLKEVLINFQNNNHKRR